MYRAILAAVVLAVLLAVSVPYVAHAQFAPDECRVYQPLPGGPSGGLWVRIHNPSTNFEESFPMVINAAGKSCGAKGIFIGPGETRFIDPHRLQYSWRCAAYPEDIPPWQFYGGQTPFRVPNHPYDPQATECLQYDLFEPQFIRLPLIRSRGQ